MKKTFCYQVLVVIFIFINSAQGDMFDWRMDRNDPFGNRRLRVKSYLRKWYCFRLDNCVNNAYFPNIYNDLRTRNCMCDENCYNYNDCCSDSKFKNISRSAIEDYSCESTVYDGLLYMVNSCAKGWHEKEAVVHKCQFNNDMAPFFDVLSLVPVTNKVTRITYKNVFCAICNDQLEDFEFWNIRMQYKLQTRQGGVLSNNQSSFTNSTIYEMVNKPILLEPGLVLSNLKLNRNEPYLTSQFNGSTYSCTMQPKLPNHLATYVRYCQSVDKTKRKCSACSYPCKVQNVDNFFEVNITNIYLPKPDDCEEIIGLNISDTFCPQSSNSDSQPTHENEEYYNRACYFETLDGKECLINKILVKGNHFHEVNNETIHVYDYDATFRIDEWSTIDDRKIYLCGTEIPTSDEDKLTMKINHIIVEIFIKFSIFFLLVYIINSLRSYNLQNLANNIIISYSVTLLATYCTFEIAQLLTWCNLASAILHYLCLSCFCWLLVASFEFWSKVCSSDSNLLTLPTPLNMKQKQFFVYAFVGWISPLLIMAVALYCEFSPVDVVPCNYKPGYGKQKRCFIAHGAPYYYFFVLPLKTIFCVNILLFLHASFYMFKSKGKDIVIRSIVQNNYSLFAKFACIMGMAGIQEVLASSTNIFMVHIIYEAFIQSQGIFVYFAFGFNQKVFNEMFNDGKITHWSKGFDSISFSKIIKSKSVRDNEF